MSWLSRGTCAIEQELDTGDAVPLVSLATAVRGCIPETEEGGGLRVTLGGVLSSTNFTTTGADVLTFPAPSRATALSVCSPEIFLVFQEIE